MKSRSLRVVPDCPQPDPPPRKPIQYGRCPLKPKGTPISSNPAPGELHAIMFSQSARTKAGCRAEPLPFKDSVSDLQDRQRAKCPDIETARRVIAEYQSMPVSDHEPPAIPQEIETGYPMPAVATPSEPPSRTAAAGFNHKETK